jgi:carbohydrate kinase (thermoresistant glucokinase family)
MAAIIVMGLAGCGKTTLGKALADRLGYRFIEGDDYHPQTNIAKMALGQALDDDDRGPWLNALANAINNHGDSIASCSALKRRYRDNLRQSVKAPVSFFYLAASFDVLATRLEQRAGHFMRVTMLDSQWATLEEPQPDESDIIALDADFAIDCLLIAAAQYI